MNDIRQKTQMYKIIKQKHDDGFECSFIHPHIKGFKTWITNVAVDNHINVIRCKLYDPGIQC